MIFDDLHNNVNSVIDRLDEMMIEAMVANKEAIIDLNIDQLEKGIGSDGLPITPEYASDEYASFKQSIGSKAPLGTPDTKLTGEFHSGFYAEGINSSNPGASGLYLDSSDWKTDRLTRKYANLFGIAPANVEDAFDPIIEDFQKTLIDELTK